jgi:polygalacturonase
MLVSVGVLAQPFFNVTEFGAIPNINQSQTTVLQKAIDKCGEAGGGTVIFPSGIYRTATLVLRDNVFLHFDTGAELVSSRDEGEFKTFTDAGIQGFKFPVQIYAASAVNIGITGVGIINGKAEYFLDDIESIDNFVAKEFQIALEAGIPMKKFKRIPPLTVMVYFKNCTNVIFRDVSFVNSVHWGIHLKSCKNVIVDGIKIFSNLEKGANADGLDIDGCSLFLFLIVLLKPETMPLFLKPRKRTV